MSYHINIVEYFEENLEKFSERIAVQDTTGNITFKQLHDRILSLASYISNELHITNSVIGVLCPKSIESVVADFAIMYSGNAYMNLDVNNPPKRKEAIINQVKPACILSFSKYNFENVSNIRFINCFDVNYSLPEPSTYSFSALKDQIDMEPLCVINTSGSTGLPKAVVLNHRSFIDFIEAVRYEKLISDQEIIGSLSPIVFDIYSFELCMMACWGSTLCVITELYAAFPAKLFDYIKSQNVTYLFWVPTIMVNIANMNLLEKFDLSSLRMVWFAGEVFPTAKFNYWYTHLPNCRFANFYGPIEITLDCLFYEIKSKLEDSSPIPIGRPFRNTSVMVLDDENKLILDESEGELCIRGSSLAMGYYANKEKTSIAFVQNPLNTNYPEIIYKTGDIVSKRADGNYIFKGRKDTLVKRMGYRIELAEIEHVIVEKLKIVKNCCVLYNQMTKDIILVYEAEHPILPRDIQKQIMQILPKYMVPTKFEYLELMPKNANGKIDRNLLKEKYVGA